MTRLEIIMVPALDTGIGREAGYADDKALVVAAREQRTELESLLTPEALQKLDEHIE